MGVYDSVGFSDSRSSKYHEAFAVFREHSCWVQLGRQNGHSNLGFELGHLWASEVLPCLSSWNEQTIGVYELKSPIHVANVRSGNVIYLRVRQRTLNVY